MSVAARHQTAERVDLFEVPVSTLSVAGTMDLLVSWIGGEEQHLVLTADATALVMAQENPAFGEVVRRASLVTADSSGVVWAVKRLYGKTIEKVSGVELVDLLTAKSAELGFRVYYLGAEPGVAERAAERMRLRHPGCNIVGARHGYFPAESDDVVAQEVAEAKPDVLFVAMGMPRQEQFVLRTQEIIGAKVAMGVGGSFDVFSGKTKRAPRLFQKAHLEWLWRLMLNPGKLSKVRKLPVFAWRVLRRPKV